MKKCLALILAVSMMLSLAACGKAPKEDVEETTGTNIEEVKPENEKKDDKKADAADKKDEAKPKDKKENEKENVKEEAKEDKKEETNEDAKEESAAKPEENKPAESKPTINNPGIGKPAKKPAETPAEKPAATPTEKPAGTAKTVGNTLLADFKAKAGSSSALAIAEALAQHEIIPFMAGASAVEPGLLAGFGNAEIKGFKSGASFMPMMGSIAFVGYVFELENGTNVNDFISTLQSNADLRWNICVEADEMVTGSVGNKVFFVMCPKQFEE